MMLTAMPNQSSSAAVDHSITEGTRRALVDVLAGFRMNWEGRLNEVEFLSRLYDLTKFPSDDPRYRNAAGDIHQHCVRNLDWPNDWVFYDSRFNLMHASDELLMRFLAETVHPIVRPDTDEARKIVDAYNHELKADGWMLTEVKQISERPLFAGQRIGNRTQIFDEPTGWQKVDRQMQEVRMRLDAADSEEEYQAVGLLCREALISVAQEVHDFKRHVSLDGIAPSNTDAKRMLEAVFETELKGSSNEDARAHAKAAVRLALALQHKRTADFVTAALCAEGTTSVVNMLAVLAGRRGRTL